MNARIVNILKSPWTSHIGVGTLALGGGVWFGYILWGRDPEYEIVVPAEQEPQLEFDFDTHGLAEVMAAVDADEVVEADEVISTSGYATAVYAPKTEAELINDQVIVRINTPEELVEVNVFEQLDSDWDWEKEIEGRGDESKPYILHKDEFYRDEEGYTHLTLTYYAQDDVMVDEASKPVVNYKKLTGPLLWGHGSGDPGTVLVRNREFRAEYEICLDPGSYEVDVLGLAFEDVEAEKDLKHSAVRRFRESD